jgi:hypothetical protein
MLAGNAGAQKAYDEVLKVVTNLFDGMRKKDTTLMRSQFAPQARLMSAHTQNGNPVVSESPIDGWLASVGRSQQSLDERIFDPEVRVDGNLATAWMKYEFWANNAFSHCGYNSFQLARTSGGWKIIHVADSRRTDGCR